MSARRLKKCILETVLILFISTVSSMLIGMAGIGKESLIMVFLLGVLFTTVVTGNYFFGILSSVVSLLLFNFLFTEPRFTLIISSSSDIVLLLFFLITAVVSGTVTSRLRSQIELTEKNERTAQKLYRISSGFLSVSGKQNIVRRGVEYIREYTGCDCCVTLDGAEQVVFGSLSVRESGKNYEVKSASGKFGVLTVDTAGGDLEFGAELIIDTVTVQMGIALDKEKLQEEQESIRLAMERERLQATLLRSVAHDIRSPLTALSGAGNLLADHYDDLDDEKRKKLATDMSEEIAWLTGLVENILNMTRIGESQLVLNKEEEVVDDVVSEALVHTQRLMRKHNFQAELPEKLLMIPMDGKLIVRVLINLLENAARHTPVGSEIKLIVKDLGTQAEFCVEDSGEGIDEAIKSSLFERFVTVDKYLSDGKRGIGLGLAICKAIVEAHKGSIFTEDNQPHGTRFIFRLPMENSDGKTTENTGG